MGLSRGKRRPLPVTDETYVDRAADEATCRLARLRRVENTCDYVALVYVIVWSPAHNVWTLRRYV